MPSQVWPGPVHYPDFLHSGARQWWRRQLAAFHDMVPWDGLWIDMNEASNFCTGEVSPTVNPRGNRHRYRSLKVYSEP